MQGSCALIRINRGRSTLVDITGIDAGSEFHRADTGLCVAGNDGSVDRGRPAPAWQQRGVHVHATQWRAVEQRLTDDVTEGDNDHHIRLAGQDLLI